MSIQTYMPGNIHPGLYPSMLVFTLLQGVQPTVLYSKNVDVDGMNDKHFMELSGNRVRLGAWL
jgi:hypothetical protein